MEKTVKQVSQELKISKPAVTQRMNTIKNFRTNYTHRIGNHLVINEKGIDLLTNYNAINHRTKTKINKINNNENSKFGNNSNQINTAYLIRQIEVKDKQIDNLQKSLDKQQTLLNQQQQLQLTTVTENRKLKERVKKLDGLIENFQIVNKQQLNDKNGYLSNTHSLSDNNNGEAERSPQKNYKKKSTKSWWHFW
ncbi:hypothetical protein B8W93_11255 [Lentilactobacillus kefiri]|uniref:DUF536 domain-containing protein n=1 Tax=Lentilactobacillus kefiri TaxID=33962 RepID=UPI000BA76E56|nr:DUF536 domain-containing protein [Lentilactobacillus kefiri]PAK80689.1 hypothetical protein B8W85_11435 [Lentilactobacillus kefiri]PAL05198.1 hypothetical protein B8W93_11255 [Lentilactobacillus kefiri]